MKTIFMSYSTRDEEKVETVRQIILKSEKCKVFKYNRDQTGGIVWEKIDYGIESSKYFLIFISRDSEQSNAVKKELFIAMNRETKDQNFSIILVYLEPIQLFNWSLDSYLRIEAFNLAPDDIAIQIKNLINKGRLDYLSPELKIYWWQDSKNLYINSERNILFPLICYEWQDEHIEGGGTRQIFSNNSSNRFTFSTEKISDLRKKTDKILNCISKEDLKHLSKGQTLTMPKDFLCHDWFNNKQFYPSHYHIEDIYLKSAIDSEKIYRGIKVKTFEYSFEK